MMGPETFSGKLAGAQTENRPSMIMNQLRDLERRLEGVASRADAICLCLSGVSAVSPSAPEVKSDAGRPTTGLYSDIFQTLQRLNSICSDIEQSLEEAIR